jgi:hypothetical protein
MGNYKIINSANIKKLSQYRYWFSFFILAEFMILYCKDSLGCIVVSSNSSYRHVALMGYILNLSPLENDLDLCYSL